VDAIDKEDAPMFGARKKSHLSVETLIEDLQAVIADAEALLRATAHQAGEKVQEVREQAEATILTARKRLLRLKKRGYELIEDGDDYVHENPWRVIGIVAGAGLAIGLLYGLNRR
jgi:ElaB/YqjD/DUF883 family membrane-anchored ribosome-binding protein